MLWENSLYKIWIIHDEHILQEIKTLVVGHRNGSFLCVRQSSNSVAHFLAKLAKSISDDVICMKDPPPPAFEALFFDVNASLLWMEVCFPQLKKKKKKLSFYHFCLMDFKLIYEQVLDEIQDLIYGILI